MNAPDRPLVIQALKPLLPAHALLWRHEDTKPFECDGLTAYRRTPVAVALPETEEQVAAVLRTCHRLGVPVVARGAGTGLSGGATPHEQSVVLSLAKFKRILQIDPLARTATVQCGVRNLAISEAVAAHGLYYAPDPSSQIACTIGGNVAENAGGVHCLKYGLTLHNVLKVRGFLADGTPVTLGSDALDASGLDLLPAVVGSEGMLMVVHEVTVKLVPKPPLARCILASFSQVRQAGEAVAGLIAAGITPAGLEMMDKPMTAAVEDFVHAGYDLDAEAILLCESDGTPEEVAEEIQHMSEVLLAHGASQLRVSQTEAERLKFWSGRKNAFPASGRLAPDYMCMDSTIPRQRLADMLEAIAEMSVKHGLRCANVFHAGDGNLHPLILFDANSPDELARCEAFGADIMNTSVAMGGAISGEHGVGLEKLGSMGVQFSQEELKQFAALKTAFDPAGLLNPGKVIPTLVRCAEGGKVSLAGVERPDPLQQATPSTLQMPSPGTSAKAHEPALQTLIDQVQAAIVDRTPLNIVGGGSRSFLGDTTRGEPISTTPWRGVVDYQPTELVITARAGTPVVELEDTLAERGQCLAFEPPRHSAASTVGGMLAIGMSGPARASHGSVRDHVLGLQMLNGRGEVLRFGGQVMKNVAGYDVSRLMVGAMGTLGLILEVSLKVVPLARASATVRLNMTQAQAIEQLAKWVCQALPVSASAWWQDQLVLRLSGAQAAVDHALRVVGGERIESPLDIAFWHGLRDQHDTFFRHAGEAVQHGAGLWRLSVPATTAPLMLHGDSLLEWQGAQRWLVSEDPPAAIRAAAQAAGGHASLHASRDKSSGWQGGLSAPLTQLHHALKQQFDPAGVFNPGRLFAWL